MGKNVVSDLHLQNRPWIQRNLDLTNLYNNHVLAITSDFLQPGQIYSKMYGTEPRFNEILVITNTVYKPKRKIFLDITNKSQYIIKDEWQTDQQG